jgi:uncharacterized RDD family membrane protein YckC
MDATTRKTISIVCLCFSLLWFAFIVLFESRYLIGVFRHQPTFRAVMRTVYEEQIEGINFIVLVVYLIPGLLALVMYRRFKKGY